MKMRAGLLNNRPLRAFAETPGGAVGGNTPARNLPVTQRLSLFYAKLFEVARAFSNYPASAFANLIAQVEDAHGFRIEPNSVQNEATARIPWRGGGLPVLWLARDLDSGKIFYGKTGEDVTDEVPGFLHNNIPRTPNFGPSPEDAAADAAADEGAASDTPDSSGQVEGDLTGADDDSAGNFQTNLASGDDVSGLEADAAKRAGAGSGLILGLFGLAAFLFARKKRRARR